MDKQGHLLILMQRFLAGETLEKKAYCQKLGLSARKFERHLSTLEALGLNIQHLRLDPLDQRKIYLNLHSVKSGSSLYQEIGEGFIRGQGPKNLYITTQPFRQISAQEESLMIRIFPVIGQRVLRFFYADTCRRVEPYGLIYRMGYLYLRGREGDKLKTWRLDRISSLMVSDELCQISAGYSLKAEMEEGSGIFIDRQPWEVIIEIRGDALSENERHARVQILFQTSGDVFGPR